MTFIKETEKIKKKAPTILMIAIALSAILLIYVYYEPEGGGGGNGNGNGQPDESWWMITNTGDPFHDYAVDLLIAHYGGVKVDWGEGRNLNSLEQDLILVGGSEDLSAEASWIRTPTMSIAQPSSYPSLKFVWNGTHWTVQTPKASYLCTAVNDYGFIAASFDTILNRWVYVTIGWSGHATIAGAFILQQNIFADGAYIVYKLTAQPTAEPWLASDYKWSVIETENTQAADGNGNGDGNGVAPTGSQSLTIRLIYGATRDTVNGDIKVTHVDTGAVHATGVGTLAINDLVYGDEYYVEISETVAGGYFFVGWESSPGGTAGNDNPRLIVAGVTEMFQGSKTEMVASYYRA